MDFFNYKKVCEQASYIKYLEEKLADAENANEDFAKANQNLQQQLYAVSVELGNPYSALQILDNDHSAQKIAHDILVLPVI